ncbi:hypothetical protein GBAR_LOCUS13589 [Geodia barretti]|uniref:Uncharacterized protein n=1 Tax=Geodia barretti TaxID=519541 RepID=A0AA35S6W2_GEOBA|nr:hypothetical protein GBAR_LOCUS13589 [Geodia barretti]
MVKIKAGMSAESSDGEGEALLATVRDKLKIQQRLIDISARSLLSSRSSSADLSQSFESQSALEVQRENSSIQETRLIKFFSRQLLVKHMFVRRCHGNHCAAAEREIDDLIDLGLFLSVADLQPLSVQLLKQEQMSLDGLFSLPLGDLESLCERLGLSREEERKLKFYLTFLTSCYNQLEKEATEKGLSYERYYSSSSRLSSVSTPGSLDERQDSFSSIPSSAASLAPAGSVFTLLSPRPYSTTTVTSTPSLLSPALLPPSPCPPHFPNGGALHHSTPRPLTPTSQSPTLSRNTSLSSSLIFQDMEQQDNSDSAPRPTRSSAHSYLAQRHSHIRSHSNPHAHLIMEGAEPRRSSPGPPPDDVRSPSPPHRANSQSSVAMLGSPGSTQRRPNHHMRRPRPLAPGSTHMVGGEQLAPESPVLRSSAYSSSHYDYPVRSNSLTYSERRASSKLSGVLPLIREEPITLFALQTQFLGIY